MTNQPDESHSLRDKVDEAISWFTHNDEPREQTNEPVASERDDATKVQVPIAATLPAASKPVESALDTPSAAKLPGNEAVSVELSNGRTVDHSLAAMPQVGTLQHSVVTPQHINETDDFVQSNTAAEKATIHAETAAIVAPNVANPDIKTPQEPISAVAEQEKNASQSVSNIDQTMTSPILHSAETTADSAEPLASTGRTLFRDEAPTEMLPAGAAVVAAVPALEQTAVFDAEEAARLRREERSARDRQLGKVIASSDDSAMPVVTKFTTPSTYKGLPSLGFLAFRLIIAGILGIRAWQHLTHLTATREMWAATILPSPGIIAWIQIGLEAAIAIMLIFGLGTRVAGVCLILLSLAQLLFVQWGVVNPFQPGATDFIGIADVLLLGAGIVFATVGGGGIAVDGAVHTGRIRRKNDKLFA